MATTYFRDEPDGSRSLVTDYTKPIAPPPSVERIDYKYTPMSPHEALQWACVFGGVSSVGAAVISLGLGISKLLDVPYVSHSAATMGGTSVAWLFAGSAFVAPLVKAWQQRIAYETAMTKRIAMPEPRKPKPTIEVDDADEWDDDEPTEYAPVYSEDDIEYAEMGAVLKYAFERGGSAPVPRTERNGVASLPLATGGTLDGNDYPTVAHKLRAYGLMAGGDGKPWKLSSEWTSLDALMDTLDAKLDEAT
jgi:hypothetical protein